MYSIIWIVYLQFGAKYTKAWTFNGKTNGSSGYLHPDVFDPWLAVGGKLV
jgi:hypothetical protein